MRAIIQRVRSASVSIDDTIIGSIGKGLVILLGISKEDTEEQVKTLVERCVLLRIFEDGDGKMNLSLKDIHGEALVISQFTLYADTTKGRRPSFTHAAPYKKAESLYHKFLRELRAEKIRTESGKFGSHMLVSIHNDGPVTITLEV
jgi:D-tyrosyl-tRNA(Tyr) deacylase